MLLHADHVTRCCWSCPCLLVVRLRSDRLERHWRTVQPLKEGSSHRSALRSAHAMNPYHPLRSYAPQLAQETRTALRISRCDGLTGLAAHTVLPRTTRREEAAHADLDSARPDARRDSTQPIAYARPVRGFRRIQIASACPSLLGRILTVQDGLQAGPALTTAR